ncbi:MAG: hypothetical protein ACNYWM_11400 [Methanosarcinales archaeon]
MLSVFAAPKPAVPSLYLRRPWVMVGAAGGGYGGGGDGAVSEVWDLREW